MRTKNHPWISGKQVAQLLGIAHNSIPRVMVAAGVRRQTIPGMTYTRYHRGDVMKLVADCVKVGPDQEQAGPIAGEKKKGERSGVATNSSPIARRERQTA